MFGFSRNELIESDLENKPSTYKSFPACMVMGCLMCILSIIMMVTTERVPSETVDKKLEYKKIEYIKNYCLDQGILTTRQKQQLGIIKKENP